MELNQQELLQQQAYLNYSAKIQEQAQKLALNEDPQLFENTNQNILSTLRKVNSIKEWNDLVQTMLSAEQEERESKLSFNLIRLRRMKNRPINGSVEFQMIEAKNAEAHQLKLKLIQTLDNLENTELELVQMEDKENLNKNFAGNRRFMENELRQKIFRLNEEYERLLVFFNKSNK